jgi:hypothetical protein
MALKGMFKAVSSVVGEVIVAGTGILAIYGLGWLSGAKSGAKVGELFDKAMDKEIISKPGGETEETLTEEDNETVPPIEVVQNQPED